MQLIYASLAALLLQAVGAAPNPFPLQTPAPALQIRQQSNTTTSAPTANPTATLTGEFTGVDGGLYEVTSESGYVIVAGHTLSAGGADALVGNGDVTVASGGFLANGQAITFLSITSTSSTAVSTTSTTAAAGTSSGAASGSQSGTAAAASSSGSSSQAGAAATGVPLAGAVLGGLMGLILL